MVRDQLRQFEFDVLCCDAEAAGLPDGISYVVVKGISDYADSHLYKEWQPYPAATAAAYNSRRYSDRTDA